MIDSYEKIYTLAMNSSVYRDLEGGRIESINNDFVKCHQFVKLEDYEIALKRILELENIIAGLKGVVI